MHACQEVRNSSFSGNVAYVRNRWYLFGRNTKQKIIILKFPSVLQPYRKLLATVQVLSFFKKITNKNLKQNLPIFLIFANHNVKKIKNLINKHNLFSCSRFSKRLIKKPQLTILTGKNLCFIEFRVQKFIEIQGWLLLTFFIRLYSQLSSFNSIIVVWKTWFIK